MSSMPASAAASAAKDCSLRSDGTIWFTTAWLTTRASPIMSSPHAITMMQRCASVVPDRWQPSGHIAHGSS